MTTILCFVTIKYQLSNTLSHFCFGKMPRNWENAHRCRALRECGCFTNNGHSHLRLVNGLKWLSAFLFQVHFWKFHDIDLTLPNRLEFKMIKLENAKFHRWCPQKLKRPFLPNMIAYTYKYTIYTNTNAYHEKNRWEYQKIKKKLCLEEKITHSEFVACIMYYSLHFCCSI